MKANLDTARRVLIIGGGPSGLIAAIAAGRSGDAVTILEANPICGKKLLLTGGGRSNILNHQEDSRALIAKYKNSAEFLHAPFARFGYADAVSFFGELGVHLKEEPGGRMFPATNDARTVLDALLTAARAARVVIRTNARVEDIARKGNEWRVMLTSGETLLANALILATGGLSHRETGSTGDGFRWLGKLGHKVIAPNPSLVPVRTREQWTHKISGLAFDDARLTLRRDGDVVAKKSGKLLFTHFGLSGPLVLNMSKQIWDEMQAGAVTLHVDLFPKLDAGTLDRELQKLLAPLQNKLMRNALPGIIETSLAPAVLEKLHIDGEKKVHQLSREERLAIGRLLKDIALSPAGLLGKDKAIVTSGGVPLDEVDTRTMESRIVPNLHITGDLLDIDRPSGGFSLQLCWTTGFVAGQSAGNKGNRE